MRRSAIRRLVCGATALWLVLSTSLACALAGSAGTPGVATGRNMTGVTTDSPGLVGPAVRMMASLAAVLALVGALAWLAQKLRNGNRSRGGLIEILSGISLGTRDKVVLLRVGEEQVLVGVSPAGMRALHVIRDGAAKPQSFQNHMEQQQS
jgi:flagellar protein FliO/FliZ